MTASGLAATVTSKLKGKASPPSSLPDFKGSPMKFRDVALDFATTRGFDRGKPNLTGGYVDSPTQSENYAGISLYGLERRPGEKRQSPTSECWVTARANPSGPGEVLRLSHLHVEMKIGEWAKVEPQVTALIDFLRSAGWLDT